MKQIETKARRKGRSPGRKEKRKRAAKALAAAGAIAGGTQAYAAPVRFDNPAHGEAGHFHWPPSPSSGRALDFALAPGEQTGVAGDQATALQQFIGGSGDAQVGQTGGLTAELEVGGYGNYWAVSVSSGETIPSGAPWGGNGYTYYPGYGSELPEGEATYLGVRFDLGSGNQYGWIGVVRTGNELEAFAWGYESDPGEPMAAGAEGGDPTGACCGPGPCQEITEAECEAMGWKYSGDGTTCVEAACDNIPTVSEWGLAIMALSLLAAGTWVVRRNQTLQA